MLKANHILIIYLTLLFLIFSKDILYPSGSILSVMIQAATLVISIVYLIKSLLKTSIEKKAFYWIWISILLLHLTMFYLAYSGIFGVYGFNGIGRFLGILFVSLSFFPIYYLKQRYANIDKYFLYFIVVMLLLSISKFFISRSEILETRGLEEADIVSNASYLFAFLFPYIYFFQKKKWVGLVSCFIFLFFSIIASKRGAFISILLSTVIYLYYYITSIKSSKTKAIKYSLSFTVILAGLIYLIEILLKNNFILERLTNYSDGGSGRDIIYSNLFNAWWNNDSIINFFIGYGFQSSLKLSGLGLFAHNDWLELLINYGFLGIPLYFLLFILCILYIVDSKNPRMHRYLLTSVVVLWLVTSIVSMNYMNSQSILQSMILAYVFSSKYQSIKQ